MRLHTKSITNVERRIQRLGLVTIKNYFHYTMMKQVKDVKVVLTLANGIFISNTS